MIFSFNFLYVMMCGIRREKNTKIFHFLMKKMISTDLEGLSQCILLRTRGGGRVSWDEVRE